MIYSHFWSTKKYGVSVYAVPTSVGLVYYQKDDIVAITALQSTLKPAFWDIRFIGAHTEIFELNLRENRDGGGHV